jgi:hypothetical protein
MSGWLEIGTSFAAAMSVKVPASSQKTAAPTMVTSGKTSAFIAHLELCLSMGNAAENVERTKCTSIQFAFAPVVSQGKGRIVLTLLPRFVGPTKSIVAAHKTVLAIPIVLTTMEISTACNVPQVHFLPLMADHAFAMQAISIGTQTPTVVKTDAEQTRNGQTTDAIAFRAAAGTVKSAGSAHQTLLPLLIKWPVLVKVPLLTIYLITTPASNATARTIKFWIMIEAHACASLDIFSTMLGTVFKQLLKFKHQAATSMSFGMELLALVLMGSSEITVFAPNARLALRQV